MSTAMTTPTRLLICQAIGKKRLLMFGYGDFVRVVEPRLFGINSAGHEMMLSAWLRPDQSRSDPEGGWRNSERPANAGSILPTGGIGGVGRGVEAPPHSPPHSPS
jgi:hypothetical protein